MILNLYLDFMASQSCGQLASLLRCRWDDNNDCLEDPRPGELTAALPVLHLIPRQDFSPPADNYQCPLYRTAARAGMLSTTGQSTNFVLHLSLPVAKGTDADKWTLQGVAALCS